jgi:hypothetical protein
MALTAEQLRVLASAFPTRGASRHDKATWVRLRNEIVAAIKPVARALEFDLETLEELGEADLADLPPHIFLAWIIEEDHAAHFFAIPEADLTEGLAQTLVMLEGLRFSGPTSVSPEQYAGALRLMAAVGSPYARDAAAFHTAYVADSPPHESLPEPAELELLFDAFAPRFVEGGAGLHHRFSRAITIVHAAG